MSLYAIQGTNAVLSIDTGAGSYETFMCTSGLTLDVQADSVAIRTVGDGPWKKSDYQALGYKLTLGGVMVFSEGDLSFWDMLQNLISTAPVNFQITYTSDDPTPVVNSVRGTAIIKSCQMDGNVGEVVKGAVTFEGSGALQVFSGYTPCDTVITGITVAGTADPAGNIDVSYTFTGDLYQVQYQVDGAGAWIIALSGVSIAIPGLAVGIHTIEIIPICSNGYQGTGLSQTFTVTQSLTCTTVITSININTSSLTATFTATGTATQVMYSIDAYNTQIVPIGSTVSFPGITVGNHIIYATPVCTVAGMLVYGAQVQQAFTISAQPAQATLDYNFTNSATLQGYQFQVFVNNVLAVSGTPGASGSINVAAAASVRAACNARSATQPGGIIPPIVATLQVIDTTTSTTLYNQSDTNIIPSLSYTFTTNGGHTYSIIENFAP